MANEEGRDLATIEAELEQATQAVMAAGKSGDMEALSKAFSSRNQLQNELNRRQNEVEQARAAELTKGIRAEILKMTERKEFASLVAETSIRSLWVRYDEDSGNWMVDITRPRAASKSTGAKTGGGGTRDTYTVGGKSGLSAREALEAASAAGHEKATKALEAVEKAKAEGRNSPGFDSAKKALIAEGVITVDPKS